MQASSNDSTTSTADSGAIDRHPQDDLLQQALATLESGDGPSALERTREAVALAPERRRGHAVQGFIEARLGRIPAAIASYERALAADPGYALARHSLAQLLVAVDRRPEALDHLKTLVDRDPGRADAQRLRIVLEAELGDPDAALAAADRALEVLPHSIDVQLARSVALRAAARLPEALSSLAASLGAQPDHPALLAEKGSVLQAMGRFAEALDAFDEALEQRDDFVYALNGLGLAELELGMREAALAAFDKVLAIEPGNLDATFYRAMALEALGHYDRAIAAYEEVLAARPGFAVAFNNIGKIWRDTGRIDLSIAAFREAIRLAPDQPQIHSNLLLTLFYDPTRTLEELTAEHVAWGDRFGRPAGQFTHWANDRDPARPLRVGLVGAEFGKHAISSFLSVPFRTLDPAEFSLYCYSNRGIDDEITDWFKARAAGWRRVVGLGDAELAALIQADAIDILIDITGHTAFNRLPCFALRPAPVQASWLGYPYTTGLGAIDYNLMDEISVQPSEERHFVEKVVRLLPGRFCYVPPDATPEVVPPPVGRQGWITFGSFNLVPKLIGDVLDSWSRILKAVPNARLILKSPPLGNPAVAERIRARICGSGITTGRVELRGGSDQLTLLQEYGDIDIALDPFPFSGGATSCEALWMGVPVVTLPMESPVSRQTKDYLDAIGRSAWCAHDIADYERIAIDLARRPDDLEVMREAQRERVRQSPLCDQEAFGRSFAAALRTMWRSHVATSSPRER